MKKAILTISLILIMAVAIFIFWQYFLQEKESEQSVFVENIKTENQEAKEELGEENEEKESVIEENNKKEEQENQENKDPLSFFIKCLADSGLIIYGSKTCPACLSLVNSLGGYEKVEPIYVECSQEWERCDSEMKTNYVPEIQIQGELYEGSRSPTDIGNIVNCKP
jgi:hypothetical protein